MDRETASDMAQQGLEIGAVYAETFSEKEDDPMEGVFRLGCLCRMVGFFLNDPDGGMPFAEEAEDYEGGGTYSASAQKVICLMYR